MSINFYKKTTAVLITFITISNTGFTQEHEWAKSLGGTGTYDFGEAVAVDASGNVYTTGYFHGTADFDPGSGTFNLTSNGDGDIFISKLDASGNFLWAKAIGGTDYDRGNAIAVDGTGNTYITGRFDKSADFDPGVGVFVLSAASTTECDFFILKLDASGNFVWAKRAGGTISGAGNDIGYGIAVDASGNSFTTGVFRGTVDFDPGPSAYTVSVGNNAQIFILQLDINGDFVWVKTMGGSDADVAYAIALDASGNIYTTGYFRQTADFNPGTGVNNLTAAMSGGIIDSEVFVSKLDINGNYVWAKRLGGTDYDEGYGIAVDGSGNVYTTGVFSETADFNPAAGTFNLTALGSNPDIFISKLNASGTFVWAKSIGGSGWDQGNSIKTDATGNSYTAGLYAGTTDMDPGVGTVNLFGSHGFVLKLDASGNYVWAQSVAQGTSASSDEVNGMCLDAAGAIYMTGGYQGSGDFAAGPIADTLTSLGNFDTYVVKLNPCNSATQTQTVTACGSYTWKNGITYSASQTGIVHVVPGVAAGGCDSVYVLNLTITPGTIALTALSQTNVTCHDDVNGAAAVNPATGGTMPYTYNWTPGNPAGDGTTSVTGLTAGTWTCTATDANGCSASKSFTITEPVSITHSFTHTACDAYTWNAQTYNTSGTYAQTFTSINGCDSLVTLNLIIKHSTSGTDVQTACDSYTWINGVTYTTSNNTATHILTNMAGCDSLVTLNLTISNSNNATQVVAACDSYTWIDGITYSASTNSATHILTNTAGCDSVVTLNLTLTNSNSATDVITACDSYTWIDGITYTASTNLATHILTNTAGCDSVVTLNLMLTNSNSGTDVITACDSYTWINGVNYTASNSTATHVLTNEAGCDSVVTLNLTVTNSNAGTDVITACNSFTWIDGVIYTASTNTATHVLTNMAGCDSTVTLNLTINANSGTDVIAACDSYTWIDGITYTASNNSAMHVLTNTAGCDSIITLNLIIHNSPNVTINDNGSGTLTASSAATYQWINCATHLVLSGETSSTFSPTVNGTYAVIGYAAALCADTSACVVIDYLGAAEWNDFTLNIYPNPASDLVTITFNEASATLIIRDVQGKPVYTKIIYSNEQVSLDELSNGIYFFELTTDGMTTVKRVLKS